METLFKPGSEVEAGDVLLNEDGDAVRVAFAIVEGARNHVSLEGSDETIVLTEDDVVEVVKKEEV